MPSHFGNCAYSYRGPRGKPVFAPSDRGREVGNELKAKVEKLFIPHDFFFHLSKGGHVAALHQHRPHKYFARLDLESFFYTIGRNRVARALQRLGVVRGEYYAKWSTVKNPFTHEGYVLPYGFVQSPLLASLVLDQSTLGACLKDLPSRISASVYVDDIAISGNNRSVLTRSFNKLKRAVRDSSFVLNNNKTVPVSETIEIFNCDLRKGHARVSDQRCNAFYAEPHSEPSVAAFERYCTSIEHGN